jgi:hypothetical protein
MADIKLPAPPMHHSEDWFTDASEPPTSMLMHKLYTGRQLRARDIEVAKCVLKACKIAVKSEHLNDPQRGEDDAYNNAVSDCFAAIRNLKVSHD